MPLANFSKTLFQTTFPNHFSKTLFQTTFPNHFSKTLFQNSRKKWMFLATKLTCFFLVMRKQKEDTQKANEENHHDFRRSKKRGRDKKEPSGTVLHSILV
tara:strand:- start:15 stop:314 length:300 start_codon:yes stop_codon:yes gene_type:complete